MSVQRQGCVHAKNTFAFIFTHVYKQIKPYRKGGEQKYWMLGWLNGKKRRRKKKLKIKSLRSCFTVLLLLSCCCSVILTISAILFLFLVFFFFFYSPFYSDSIFFSPLLLWNVFKKNFCNYIWLQFYFYFYAKQRT